MSKKKTTDIKNLKKYLIIILGIVLVIEGFMLFAYISSLNSIIDGGVTIEHKDLVSLLSILSYCVSIASILVLGITVLIVKNNNKKFYYKLVGVFTIFIFIIPCILSLLGGYIHDDDIKNERYTSWFDVIEEEK